MRADSGTRHVSITLSSLVLTAQNPPKIEHNSVKTEAWIRFRVLTFRLVDSQHLSVNHRGAPEC
jgi:hypothetical protein